MCHSSTPKQFDTLRRGPVRVVDINPSSAIGSTIALGVSLGSRWVQPSIEFRYTRWAQQPLATGPGLQWMQSRTKRNFLAGLMFDVKNARPNAAGVRKAPQSAGEFPWGSKAVCFYRCVIDQGSGTPDSSVFGTCMECGTSRTLPYVAGPALEIRIAGGLSATAEVLRILTRIIITSVQTKTLTLTPSRKKKHSVGLWEARFY